MYVCREKICFFGFRVFDSRTKECNKTSNLKIFMWAGVHSGCVCHLQHIHSESAVSGTYYVSAPKGSGALVLTDPRGLLPPFGGRHLQIKNKKNMTWRVVLVTCSPHFIYTCMYIIARLHTARLLSGTNKVDDDYSPLPLPSTHLSPKFQFFRSTFSFFAFSSSSTFPGIKYRSPVSFATRSYQSCA